MMHEIETLAPASRVWVYQSKTPIKGEKHKIVSNLLNKFAGEWVSHNRALKANAQIVDEYFIVLMVDESAAGASGCSIDASVHFLQSLETAFDLTLFDRMHFACKTDEGVKVFSNSTFAEAFKAGEISEDTLVYDTLVKTKNEFDQAFLKPLGQSWHRRFI